MIMKKLLKMGAVLCTMILGMIVTATEAKAQDVANLNGTWIEVFYEFNFDAGKVESKTYKFEAMLSNQEKWIFAAKGDTKFNLQTLYFARNDGGFVEDGDFDINVVDNKFVTEFTDNFKITKLTADELVIECYNDKTLKERKTFKKKAE